MQSLSPACRIVESTGVVSIGTVSRARGSVRRHGTNRFYVSTHVKFCGAQRSSELGIEHKKSSAFLVCACHVSSITASNIPSSGIIIDTSPSSTMLPCL